MGSRVGLTTPWWVSLPKKIQLVWIVSTSDFVLLYWEHSNQESKSGILSEMYIGYDLGALW